MKKSLVLTLISFLMLALTGSLHAQQKDKDKKLMRQDHPALVRMSLETIVTPEDTLQPMLSNELMDRIIEQDHLAHFSMNSFTGNRYQIGIRFQFADVDRFRSWYRSDRARRFLEFLRERGDRDIDISININRMAREKLMHHRMDNDKEEREHEK